MSGQKLLDPTSYATAECTVKKPGDGQRNCPKHVEFHAKLVHLVGFNIKKFVTLQHGHMNVKNVEFTGLCKWFGQLLFVTN